MKTTDLRFCVFGRELWLEVKFGIVLSAQFGDCLARSQNYAIIATIQFQNISCTAN